MALPHAVPVYALEKHQGAEDSRRNFMLTGLLYAWAVKDGSLSGDPELPGLIIDLAALA